MKNNDVDDIYLRNAAEIVNKNRELLKQEKTKAKERRKESSERSASHETQDFGSSEEDTQKKKQEVKPIDRGLIYELTGGRKTASRAVVIVLVVLLFLYLRRR